MNKKKPIGSRTNIAIANYNTGPKIKAKPVPLTPDVVVVPSPPSDKVPEFEVVQVDTFEPAKAETALLALSSIAQFMETPDVDSVDDEVADCDDENQEPTSEEEVEAIDSEVEEQVFEQGQLAVLDGPELVTGEEDDTEDKQPE